MNDRHMSLMLLETLKIVSCLKKYDHSDDDGRYRKITMFTHITL